MTVQTIPPTPTRAPASLAAKRFPPLADRSALGHRLTGLSRQKLAREATAPDPDVRRCLAHFRLHVASMEWSNKDVSGQIGSVELESDDDEGDRENEKRECEWEERVIQRDGDGSPGVKGNGQESRDSTPQSPPSSTSDVLHVSFHVAPPVSVVGDDNSSDETQPQPQPPSPKKDDGLLERSRSCLEKTAQKKHFWSSSGQCVPVRIAS